MSAFRATIQLSENRISRLLFKLAVKISMMMNVLAIGLEIDDTQMDRLRVQCVQAVKRSNGGISFKHVMQTQNNGEHE